MLQQTPLLALHLGTDVGPWTLALEPAEAQNLQTTLPESLDMQKPFQNAMHPWRSAQTNPCRPKWLPFSCAEPFEKGHQKPEILLASQFPVFLLSVEERGSSALLRQPLLAKARMQLQEAPGHFFCAGGSMRAGSCPGIPVASVVHVLCKPTGELQKFLGWGDYSSDRAFNFFGFPMWSLQNV